MSQFAHITANAGSGPEMQSGALVLTPTEQVIADRLGRALPGELRAALSPYLTPELVHELADIAVHNRPAPVGGGRQHAFSLDDI